MLSYQGIQEGYPSYFHPSPVISVQNTEALTLMDRVFLPFSLALVYGLCILMTKSWVKLLGRELEHSFKDKSIYTTKHQTVTSGKAPFSSSPLQFFGIYGSTRK